MDETKLEIIQLEAGLKVALQAETKLGVVNARGEVIYVGSHHFRVRCTRSLPEDDLEPNQEVRISLANRPGMLPVTTHFIRILDSDNRIAILRLPSGNWQQNRRAFFRGDVETKVVVLRGDGTRVEGMTHNLSGGGALIRVDAPLGMRESIQVILEFHGRESVGAKARVVRVVELGDLQLFGIQFTDISTREQNNICRMVLVGEFEARRAEMRELTGRSGIR